MLYQLSFLDSAGSADSVGYCAAINAVSYSKNWVSSPLKNARTITGSVHMGTRKRRAGCGCSKINMAKNVSMMP